ncbi:L-lactate dehydrogenase [Spiroplasma endosymbiont of Labia minor]|uniref:L-lactate dehydrogenase n=1 Tax=Spiroplasma endosymbiont of Labia minor TaxID=3066305 RepID=UPI0030D5A00F
MKKNKVVLVGCGAVGTSFLYAAINQGLASEYVLIDVFPDAAEGNAIDLADTMAVLPTTFTSIKAGTYADCSDAEVVVVTAGRPQKPGETRIEMVSDNAKIMKEIAIQIKDSGFNGISIIASNPVDVLTTIYQEVTGFNEHKVIGSGTTLDSARLRRLLAEKLEVAPTDVDAYLIGEHGDSSVPVWSKTTVMGKAVKDYLDEEKISQADLDKIWKDAVNMAYVIIEKKRATFYGIGVCLARLMSAVLRNERQIFMIGAKLNDQYNHKGFYTGVPALISANGWEYILEWNLSTNEQAGFDKSSSVLKDVVEQARKAIA